MFSSLFSDPNLPDLHPVSSAFAPSDLFAPLNKSDLEWTCLGGFAVETQTFYHVLEDGRFLMGQAIYSSTGLWYPTIQFTFKLYDPATKEVVWRSVTANEFVSPPPGQDKRSCKSDLFTIVHRETPGDPEHAENYTVNVQLGNDLQMLLNVSRPSRVPGVKVGNSPQGGYTYFGQSKEKPDGYVVHRFWPRTKVSGHLKWGGSGGSGSRLDEFTGVGMMVHAIQGLRPNLVATRWNFCWFTGKTPIEDGEQQGVSAIMMEFTTPSNYGRKRGGEGGVTVNVGNVSVGDKVVVTAETKWPDEAAASTAPVLSRATHLDTRFDKDTGYRVPQNILFDWQGPLAGNPEGIKAELTLHAGSDAETKTLIQKVDVLAEIPKVLKAIVNATGTKPYIYQWMQTDAILKLKAPSEAEVQGVAYVEASYVS